MNIAENLQRIKQELPSTVGLVAVSKFHPSEAVSKAYEAGQRIFGESRPQELFQKVSQLPKDIRWHFIGHLQTNKLKFVVPYVELIHSVDSLRLLEAIARYCEVHQLTVDVLLEVFIACEETKSGFTVEEAESLLMSDLLPICGERVRIRGLMGMASLTDDQEQIRNEFKRLTALFDRVQQHLVQHPSPVLAAFDIRSFGMSSDYRIAIEEGATYVRIGTDIFGPREY